MNTKDKKIEDIVRSLTIAQLDALNSIINNEKIILSSREVLAGCTQIDRRQMSPLSTLSKGDRPLIKKVGKLSIRDGLLWRFNNVEWDKAEVKGLVNVMVEELKEGGYFKE